MPVYCVRLLPPRPTFPADMTPAEGDAMMRHVAYWTALAKEGKAVAFGPVADPAGSWGLGVLETADEAELRALLAADPVAVADLGFRQEILPMPRGVVTRG